MLNDVRKVIEAYRLEPHPEGGWFREFHRSGRSVGPLPGFPGPRPAVTAIHFLLTRETFSAFHRLRSDEIWIHLAGAPLSVALLGPEAQTEGEYALAACIVAPGFDYADFEIPPRDDLLRDYPEHAELIRRLTRSGGPS